MAEYKKQFTGYVNQSKDSDRQYLAITNVSEEDYTIKAGEKLFLNRTPADIIAKYPKVPHYSRDIKMEDQGRDAHVDTTNDSTIPF